MDAEWTETVDGLRAEVGQLRRAVADARDPPVLLERDDVARLMSIGVSTFDRLRAAGRIGPAAVRVGGGLRWHRAEVLAWLGRPTPAGELHDADTWPAVWARPADRR